LRSGAGSSSPACGKKSPGGDRGLAECRKGSGTPLDLEKRRGAMCEAHAFVVRDGKEQRVLENVDRVELEGEEVRLVSVFGEQMSLSARLKLYDSRERKFLFELL
jgi:hypothetical protein